ncbi:MAG: DUF3343 domain-containing protein [Lachnospiraceae bacterium]|nr:DUF3343 domain-containing protein [Lachnospiraceae bacterium]
MTCIATFFAHIGAIRFKKYCDAHHITARIMPVPRTLSSSCGTCVKFICDNLPSFSDFPPETEAVVEIIGTDYRELYRAEDS